MTIDERIERLVERHEALAQSVALLGADNRQTKKRMGEIMQSIASLVRVAEIHEGGRA